MRKNRIKQQGAIYNICARANRQEMIFKEDQFKELLLNVILDAKKKYSFLFRNFCIMNNDIHLEIEPIDQTDISRIMQWILSVFAKRYNRVFHYKGHVWYDRFKSKIINSLTQYINTFFYIASNPVRANIVKHPIKYKYNGVSFNIKRISGDLLDPQFSWFKPFLDKFLVEFTLEKHLKPSIKYSFRDKKPGRPKKHT